MKSNIIICAFCAASLAASICLRANADRHYETRIRDLEYLSSTTDRFLEEYTKAVYGLRDHIVMDDEALERMHHIDSLAYGYYQVNNVMDYNVYALDINYYYEQKRNQQ